MIGDRELLEFRQGYYELLVSLFSKEPEPELLRRLADGITERIQAARNFHALLAKGWEGIQRFLAETPAEDLADTVADEYTRLFIGPHELQVNPYESYYFTGHLWDRPLADIRTFLKTIGIEKQDHYAEPEDSLAFQLEVMRWLIGKQLKSADREEEMRWLQLQADFLKGHLLVWLPACAQDIEKAEGAKFYAAAANILLALAEMERGFFSDWGMDKVTPLEDVRRRYGAIPSWKGPTFEMPGDSSKNPSNAKKS